MLTLNIGYMNVKQIGHWTRGYDTKKKECPCLWSRSIEWWEELMKTVKKLKEKKFRDFFFFCSLTAKTNLERKGRKTKRIKLIKMRDDATNEQKKKWLIIYLFSLSLIHSHHPHLWKFWKKLKIELVLLDISCYMYKIHVLNSARKALQQNWPINLNTHPCNYIQKKERKKTTNVF